MNREVPEGTRLLTGGLEKLMEIWNRLSAINGYFDDYSNKAENFINMYIRQDTWWLEREDGNGILYLTLIQPGLSAMAHIAYWDKRLRGREQFTMDCLLFAVNAFDLRKVNVVLPDFSYAAIAFTERLGFTLEGKLRDWSYCKGKLYGIHWYGITREEILNGRRPISEQGDGEHSETVPRDGGLSEVVPVPGGPTDRSALDTVQPSGGVGDEREHQSEPTADPGLPDSDSEDGEHRQ